MDTTRTKNRHSQTRTGFIKYQPGGKMNPGCPFKRLLGCNIETRTGHEA